MLFVPFLTAAAPIIGSAISGVLGYKGAKKTNQVNQQEAEKNRMFQERMRNTQWQAGVADMEAAGLNPALAYSQGGAASPSGSTPPGAENPVTSALGAMQMRKSLQLLETQVQKTKAEADSASAKARVDSYKSDKLFERFSANGVQSVPLINRLIEAEVNQAEANVEGVRSNTERTKRLEEILGPSSQVMDQLDSWIRSLRGAGGRAMNNLRDAKRRFTPNMMRPK